MITVKGVKNSLTVYLFLSDSVEFLGMIRSSPQTPDGATKEKDQVDDVD